MVPLQLEYLYTKRDLILKAMLPTLQLDTTTIILKTKEAFEYNKTHTFLNRNNYFMHYF